MWGNSNYNYVCSDSIGSSGGILCVWEKSVFRKENVTVSDNFIAIYGTWISNSLKVLFIVIYAPQQLSAKNLLWDYVSSLINNWSGEAIVMGDFNEVRCNEERYGSSFNTLGARRFNEFIMSAGLVDINLEGYKFTWSHPSASKMSKLDRFLVTEGTRALYMLCMHNCISESYDCVRWDYLLDVMKSFGFGPNWCRWIQGTLSSAKASILVNGSPTAEFSFYRGLKQGDPLSPFLFILIMESLHLSMVRASSNGMFRGLCLNGSLSVSHLFYADDAMFIGEWSQANLDNVVKMLQCFQVASGLSINIQKSNLLGVGVRRSVVDQAANKIGCLVMSNRFSYLGVMVGDSMNRRAAWVEVINKLRARLSNWKVKTLSIGGRYTLLKSVLGSSPLYHMSIFKTPKGVLKEMEGIRGKFFNGADPEERKIVWVAWQKVLASKSQGGLGMSSFFALNRALLLKWYWRFLTKYGSLWSQVIQAIHGDNFNCANNSPSLWSTIIREINSLKDIGFDFMSHCKIRIGNGCATKFWTDKWALDVTFRDRFPRVYALDMEKDSLVANKLGGELINGSFRRNVRDGVERQQWEALLDVLANVSLTPNADRWVCDLTGDGNFRVKEVRNFLDDLVLPSSTESTRWVKWVPIKTNIFIWKARRDCLPTRFNLSRKGVMLDSILCPLCDHAVETTQHVLFQCPIVRSVFHRICNWWELEGQDLESFSEWQSWFLSIRMSAGTKNLLDGVFATFWWYMWGFRNRSIFDSSAPRRSVIFDEVVALSFNWVSSRCKKFFYVRELA
ncbi:RNA-directed DNA polymerase, eukaryota [Tanacetum coccineum]|uniref:RNA-directed DNA polymerase, eukaryota n=1 Tax=Tanacetum coccineum TaxID=301880 RepID=A0ABQ4ZR95_9ASTR